MKSFKSFGEKVEFHSECIAKKMYMVQPILEEDVLKNIKTLESLLRIAKCPDEGCVDGTTQSFDMQNDIVAEQCQWCAEKDRMINKFEINE